MTAADSPWLATAIARHIWQTKYRWVRGGQVQDQGIEDTWQRVARAAASVEAVDADAWAAGFYEVLQGFRFLPGGRILAGAGTDRRVTLFNCFVMGLIEDDMEGIFESLKEAALTMQAGGGVGYDFSTLRPGNSITRSTGRIASGPVSFMHVWDAMCDTAATTRTSSRSSTPSASPDDCRISTCRCRSRMRSWRRSHPTMTGRWYFLLPRWKWMPAPRP
jgi:ribonucleotide reductase alpha subunit